MTEPRAFANQEREFQVRRLGKLGRALLMTLASVLSLLTLTLLVADQLFHPDAFVIQELKIKGKFRYLEPTDVDALLRTQDLGNFFSVELDELKANVEDLEWVQSADIRRQWPNSLIVSIIEHKPAMRWGKDKWVSTTGSVISLPSDVNRDNVVILEGDQAQSKRILLQAARWQRDFASNGLELRKTKLSSSHAWTLRLYSENLDSEFYLLLGREHIVERLARFNVLFNEQLKFSDHTLKRIDARYPDGLAVQYGNAKQKTKTSSDTGVAMHVKQGSSLIELSLDI